MCKHAVIICGGKGSRLKPYTDKVPKALLCVGDLPMLEIIIRQLRHYNYTSFTLAINHQADIIQDYFENGDKLGINMTYSHEKVPLGTVGPLKIINDLPEDFLFMNCDILTNIDFEKFFQYHIKSNQALTIAGYQKRYKLDYGVLEINKDQKLTRFQEKPESLLINAGMYVANKRILEVVPDDSYYCIDHLINDLLLQQSPIAVYPFSGYWLDIGNPQKYQQAIQDIKYLQKLSFQ